ncbi:phage tail tube protein [Salininema proteolyticum]|uniref:Major tail protein n=1 Tax=Salininema proteolyticum TaxID=1607685 RepID=A0ABV8TWR2_9ACTN
MTLTASEVRVAITGELFSAPQGSTMPADATTALDAAFIGHGYTDENGVAENWDDSVDNKVAWQNATIVRASRTESLATFRATLLQTRGSNLELFYPGSSVSTNATDEWKLEVVPAQADPRSFVINIVDGAIVTRIAIGNGEVTERGEVPHRNGDVTAYPITITCYPDDAGLLFTKYSTDAAWGIDIA